jgi:hypothetical protein
MEADGSTPFCLKLVFGLQYINERFWVIHCYCKIINIYCNIFILFFMILSHPYVRIRLAGKEIELTHAISKLLMPKCATTSESINRFIHNAYVSF